MLNFYFQIWKFSTLLRKPPGEKKWIHMLLPHLLGIQGKKEKEKEKKGLSGFIDLCLLWNVLV